MIDWNNPTSAKRTIDRAEKVLVGWLQAGHLTADELRRVLSGEFHYYATFSRVDRDRGISPDGYAVVTGAQNEGAARAALLRKYPANLLKRVIPEWEFVDQSGLAAGELDRLEAQDGDEKERVTVDQ